MLNVRTLLIISILTVLLLTCGRTERRQGQALYVQHCANCHMEDGSGLRQLIPPLAGADYLRDNPREVVRGMRYGMAGPMIVKGVTYDHPMPGNLELTEFQIVNIANYINHSWGNNYGEITVQQARDWLTE